MTGESNGGTELQEQHEQNLRDLRLIREDPAWALTAVQKWRELEARVQELEDALARIDGLAGEGIEDVDLYEAITDLTRIGYRRGL